MPSRIALESLPAADRMVAKGDGIICGHSARCDGVEVDARSSASAFVSCDPRSLLLRPEIEGRRSSSESVQLGARSGAAFPLA
jgi:hypothetical protein